MARHLRGRQSGRRRPTAVIGVIGVLVVALLGACGPGTTTSWQAGEPKPPAELSFSLEDQTGGVSPRADISVTVENGTLDTVSLTGPSGDVQGAYDEKHAAWRAVEPLLEGASYTLTAKSTGIDGVTVSGTRSFSTVTPDNHVSVRFAKYWSEPIVDGDTYGVGQPIIAWFDEPIPDKAAASAAMTVTAVPATEGAWYWYDDREAHWRPKDYWEPGTKVTVESNLYGTNLGVQANGNTLYGDGDNEGNATKVSFTIGDSHIAEIDNNTHQMTVWINGQIFSASSIPRSTGYWHPDSWPADTIPVSLGMNGLTDDKGNYFDLRTYSGISTVMDKGDPVKMQPAGIDKTDSNYYEELIPKAVRFTSSGEYVHWADWSIGAQGNYNASHGCANIHPDYAVWFFSTFITGDIVSVKNTGVNLPSRDGITDWNIPWDQWVAGGAV